MKCEFAIQRYKTYLREEVSRMESPEYGNYNQSLLETYKIKLDTLNYLTKQDKHYKDRLALCKWLME